MPSYLRYTLLTLFVLAVFGLIFCSGHAGLIAMTALLAIIALSLLVSIVMQLKNAIIKPVHRLYVKDFSLKFTATLMGFLLIVGMLLYIYVFYQISNATGTDRLGHDTVATNNVEYFFRSLICSLDLFMLDVDSNILDRLDGHAVLKGWILFHAAISFSCTVILIIGILFARLRTFFKLNFLTRVTDKKNHLYIFFDNCAASRLLINDVLRNDDRAIAIMVDTADVRNDDNDGWDGIVRLISHNHTAYDEIQRIGARVAVAGHKLSDIDSSIAGRPDFDAFGYLGLSKIKKLIGSLHRTENPELHVFFLGDNEEENMRDIIAIAGDVTMQSVVRQREIKLRIYCHARYNDANKVIEDVALGKGIDVRIVDSSHIAVDVLKSDASCHPVTVASVNHENPTTVDAPFNALIVGFGEIGRDVFRFLYEFGAFVDSSSDDIVAKRSPFCCQIVDKRINDIKGRFCSSMPAVFSESIEPEKPQILFHQADYNSELFHREVLSDSTLSTLNYVVISIGNSDEAIELAALIFNRARALRPDMSNLRIFVRCREDEKNQRLQKIADHYNYGYGDGIRNNPVIRIFGQPHATYTFDHIVSDRFTKMGIRFHERYCQIRGEGGSWIERHQSLSSSNVYDLDKLSKLRRQESQDMANAFHIATKKALADNVLSAPGQWSGFLSGYFNPDGTVCVTGSYNEIHYPQLSERDNRMVLRLAMLEHLRWNAAHELMGYVFSPDGDGCDERRRRHSCLCPWNKLNNPINGKSGADYMKYDFSVVDTTFSLIREDSVGENK